MTGRKKICGFTDTHLVALEAFCKLLFGVELGNRRIKGTVGDIFVNGNGVCIGRRRGLKISRAVFAVAHAFGLTQTACIEFLAVEVIVKRDLIGVGDSGGVICGISRCS